MTPIYLDSIAATKPHPDVVAAMLPWLTEHFGNPMSLHAFGEVPRTAVEAARAQVAPLVAPNVSPAAGPRPHAGVTGTHGAAREGHHHVSAIEPSFWTCGVWHEVVCIVPLIVTGWWTGTVVVAVGRFGAGADSVADANRSVRRRNRAGPRERGVVVHTDAVAAGGRIALDVRALGVDALSLAASQFYGPPGVGALYVRRGVRLEPLLVGGVQEAGRRAGGHNVPAIVGMGRAASLVMEHGKAWQASMAAWHQLLAKRLSEVEGVLLTGHPDRRLPGHVSACFEYVEGEALVRALGQAGVAASSGSACSDFTVSSKVSHVLSALGVEPTQAQGSVVFSLDRDTTEQQVRDALRILPPIIERLRRLSPLYRVNR
jgi:cysteine desulfurase